MSDCYVFHIQLEEIVPAVWRRIKIRKGKTFWDLHCAIQDAMPWEDRHLHEFRFPTGDEDTQIGIPDDDGEFDVLPSWETLLRDWFLMVPNTCSYLYDFGDSWQHTITLEAIQPAEKGGKYPRCTAGERRCPPEDVGGYPGYEEFQRALADPNHEEHDSYRRWIGGGSWDPEKFRPEEVRFSRPISRLRRAGLA